MTPTTPTNISPKQLEANRANSQHSTGPVTDAGKDKVRVNALKHGMYSTATLLPGEDREAYEALGRMLLSTVNPGSEEEIHLLKVVQDLDWQLLRIRALDTNYYTVTLERELEQFADKDPAAQQAYASVAAYEKNAKMFNQISRTQARLARQREKAINEFCDAQAIRIIDEQAAAKAAAEEEAARAEAARKEAARTEIATRYSDLVATMDRELAAMPDNPEDDDIDDEDDLTDNNLYTNGFVPHNAAQGLPQAPDISPETSPEGN